MTSNSKQHGGNSGNFAEDPKRASDAGKKGGQHSHQQSQSHPDDKRQHGGGNFADDPKRASEAGRKGGQK